MQRISKPVAQLRSFYEVVVVGSGYGGGIAANRFARAGRDVCVLERGREFLAGDFPQTEARASMEFRVKGPETQVGPATGLYDVHVDKDITIIKGCGLGGTSLINANVSLRADPRVFEDTRWPKAVRDDLKSGLEAGYSRAEAMLKPQTYPSNRRELAKVTHLRAVARDLGEKCHLTPINVNFEDCVNEFGIEQKACNDCGDCVSGCNRNAKNTTRMNYLPDAYHHGADIFCEVEVAYVRRLGDRWVVVVQPLNLGREHFDAPPMHIFANIVVLAAGALGSTEILLRSAQEGLPVSSLAGKRFTGNGDVLGFSYNGDRPIHAIGFGSEDPSTLEPVGPCITAYIDARSGRPLSEAMVTEDGATPGAIGKIAMATWAKEAIVQGQDFQGDLMTTVQQKARQLESVARGYHYGATDNSQTFLVMAHDSDDGQLSLENNQLRIRWPGVGKQSIFEKANEMLAKAAKTNDGMYLRNPIWSKLFDQPLITVHPLGGCCMGENAQSGVVDHKGQVFTGKTDTDLHPGLYVMDGAIIPMSLGVNPLLTICAVAERCVDLVIRQHGFSVSYDMAARLLRNVDSPKVGVRFTEMMNGHFSRGDRPYAEAEELGKLDGHRFSFIVTIESDHLDDMLENEEHEAKILGTVEVPLLSPNPLTVTHGSFTLFKRDPNQPGVKNMIYRLGLSARTGAQYFLEGIKFVRDDAGDDAWADTSTLFITVWEGDSNAGALVGRGVVRNSMEDFAKQLLTMKITNAPNRLVELTELARFGSHFMGELWKVYGDQVQKRNA